MISIRSRSAGMNRAELVRGRDEQHAREIESDLHVVVAERVVLRRVQHFEERGGRIALHADRDLVDLVEHQHRVRYAGGLQRLHDAPGHGADVRAPVPADLRFVPHAAQRDPHELPVHRSRDRLPERGLADARRADEAQDRPFHADGARGSGGAWRPWPSPWPLADAAVREAGSPPDSSVRRCRSFCTARYSTMRSLTLSRS